MKRTRPRAMSALVVPQPDAGSATAARAARTSSRQIGVGSLDIRRSARRSLYVPPARKRFVQARTLGRLEAILTSSASHEGRRTDAGARRNVRGGADRRPEPYVARGGGDDGR